LRQEDEISRDIKLFDYDPFKSSDSDYVHLFRESVTEEFGISLKYVQIDLNNGNISSLDIDQGISYYSKPVRTDNRWYIAYMKGGELIIKFISISDTHEVQLRETFRASLFHFDLKDLIVIKNYFDLDYIYVRSGTKIYLVAGPDSLELVSDFGIGTYNFIFDDLSHKLLYLNGGSVVKSAYVDDQSSARNLYSKRFLSQKFKGIQFYSDFTINQMSIKGLKITLAIYKDSNPQPTTYIILRPFLPLTQKIILFKEPQRGYKETGVNNGKIIYLTNKGTINSINRQSGKESKIGKINCDGVLLNDTDYVVNFVLKTESEVDCSDIKLNITDKNMPIKFFQLN
jgi:hypothetical protein